MLELENVETFYGTIQALFGMSLRCDEGQVTTLIGRNGMGKTTTVGSIMGTLESRNGEIRFDGVSIRGKPAYRVAQLGIGLVPEGRQIFPNLNVRENLLATPPITTAAMIRGRSTRYSSSSRACMNGSLIRAASSLVASSKCSRSDAR